MNRLRFLASLAVALSFAAVLPACGSKDEPAGTGGTGGSVPTPPTFKGLDEARSSQQGAGASVRLYWWPAKSDKAPAEEIKYTLRVWTDDPALPGTPAPQVTDVTPLQACSNRCVFPWMDGIAESVRWFSVEAKILAKEEGEEDLESESGIVKPGVIWIAAPEVGAPEPSTAARGDTVIVRGDHFLDRMISADALKVGGVPVPPALIQQWNNKELHFTVPDAAVSGAIEVMNEPGAGKGVSAGTLEVQ